MHIKILTYFQRNNVRKAEHHIILQLYISKLSKLKLLNKAPKHRKKFSAYLRVTETENRMVVRSKFGDKPTML